MNYVGEHLLPGQIGHFFLIFSFAASFVATLAYYKATIAKDPDSEASWKRMARLAFRLNALAVLAIFSTIIYIISNHYFEYNYAWEHSSKSLPPQYLLACIWEAQEGSFLLWIIWQCILGLVLIRTSKKFGQLCLATMIIGIYVSNIKIGINPFLLVRQMEGFANAPIFNSADYLKIPQMQDGQGFNSLLQNYWVVIHPPVLFLGFASSIVPFAYAMAGIWKKDYSGWTRAALPWTLFAACVLGTGVMMGAAWAYEALSFGGFWSWDPAYTTSLPVYGTFASRHLFFPDHVLCTGPVCDFFNKERNTGGCFSPCFRRLGNEPSIGIIHSDLHDTRLCFVHQTLF